MPTLNEIVYSIRNIIRAGKVSDDDTITAEQIAYHVHNTRAMLIRQQFDKGQTISDNHIQWLECLDLEQVDTSFLPGIPTGCKVYRTKQTIPQPVEVKNKDLIFRVTLPEFASAGIDIVTINRVYFYKSAKFKNAVGVAVFYNERLYIVSDLFLSKLTLGEVIANPEDASNFATCDGTSQCFSWDSQYPISEHLLPILENIILDKFKIISQVPQDDINDTDNNLQSQATDKK